MRIEHIQSQQKEGRHVVVALPVHYPKPIFTAMSCLCVELWGPPGPPRGPGAGRIQPYVCSVVRNAMAFLAHGDADIADAILFPHTCDSIQGLASLAPDFGGWSKPTFRFLHPRGTERPVARAYLRSEIRLLAKEIERVFGEPLEETRLRWAVDLHREIDHHRRLLLEKRLHLPLGDLELYQILRRGEFLWPEIHLEEIKQATGRIQDAPCVEKTPLMITGYVPEPMSLLAAIDDAGGCVVADDYAAIGRRVPIPSEASDPGDPFEDLLDDVLALPPCPTRHVRQRARLDYLEGLYEKREARGLLIHVVKFCEPELFDVPAIKKEFTGAARPVLYLESELEGDLAGQNVTRIEAFLETIEG